MSAPENEVNRCLYCGNKPVPHRMNWIHESLSVVHAPFDRWVSQTGLARFVERQIERLMSGLFWLMRLVGLSGYNHDPNKAASFRATVLWEEANRRGIAMRSLTVGGNPVDWYEADLPTRGTIVFDGLPRPWRGTSLAWMDDKMELKKRLMAAGLPVAAGGSFSKWDDLLARYRTLTKPVIIKPRLGSRGRHTTTFISNEADLEKAFKLAKQLCHWVVMEEHLMGSVYRGTVIGGRCIGILAGDPPRITGDGTHTISELVVMKNATKPAGITDALITPATHEFLARQGLSLESILEAGRTIDLTEKIGVNYGGASREVSPDAHPDLFKIMEAAGKMVNDPLLGFDFIIDDISRNPAEQRWGIIECNSLPFINLHHDPLIGTPVNAAKAVWDLWEPELDIFPGPY